MLSFAPDYDHLPLISKVEVFEYALLNTEGNDLSRVRDLDCHIYHIIFPVTLIDFRLYTSGLARFFG